VGISDLFHNWIPRPTPDARQIVVVASNLVPPTRDLPVTLRAWRNRFRNVLLEHLDWYAVFEKYDSPSTFWFMDPPYHPGTVIKGGLYAHVLGIFRHERLIQVLLNAKGYVLLCGYNHPMYTSHLFHWRHVAFSTRTIMARAGHDEKVIWMNYEADGHKIASDKLLIAKTVR